MAVFGHFVKDLSYNMQGEQLQLTSINGKRLKEMMGFFCLFVWFTIHASGDRGFVLVLIPVASVRVFLTALVVPSR